MSTTKKPALPPAPRRGSSPMAPPRSPRGRSDSKMGESSNVRVMVRVRPFADTEIQMVEEEGGYMQSVIDMPRDDQVLLLDHNNNYEIKQGFNFDKVFWSCTQQQSDAGFSDQRAVYENTGELALEAAWDGMNSCIFAYGQTGSGKTHTMMGDPSQIAQEGGCDTDLLGVIPRLCRQLFEEIEERGETAMKAGFRKQAEVEVRFMEIYNEKVKDLLVNALPTPTCQRIVQASGRGSGSPTGIDSEDLRIREHPITGPYVVGLTLFKPTCYEDVISLINQGNMERHTATTKMNDRSSRSHAIFRMTLTQTSFMQQERVGIGGPKTVSSERRANINLVDLAGSENVKRSGATGSTLVEAQKINLSLTTLRRVIDALIDRKPSNVVPYRDSTLTWLLREDLGGNARTFMLATVSPHYSNAHESQRTLEYAMRARSIVNVVRVNEDNTAKMLADLEKRILETQKAMAQEHTKEEMKQLEQYLEEANSAKDELSDRLAHVMSEAEGFKAELRAVREKQAASAFHNAWALKLAKSRLEAAERKASEKQSDLEKIKQKAQDMGHDSFDSMAGSLVFKREEISKLMREKEEIEERARQLQQREQDLQKELAAEKEQEEKLRVELDKVAQETEKGARGSKKEATMNTSGSIATTVDAGTDTLEAGSLVERVHSFTKRKGLVERYEQLLKTHEEEKQAIRDAHEKEVKAILRESESMALDHQGREQELQMQLVELREKARKDLRLAAQDAAYQQRLHHHDIERLQRQVQDLQKICDEAKAKVSEAQAQLEVEREAKSKAVAECQRLSAMFEEERNSLQAAATTAEATALQKQKEKVEVTRFLEDVNRKESSYREVFELAEFFSGKVDRDGNLPPDWTLDTVKGMMKSFMDFKHSYTSNKPSAEAIKAMLKQDPQRKDASRLTELMKDSGKGEGRAVLMDGLPCPELGMPALRRSNSPPQHYDVFSAADNVAFPGSPRTIFQNTPRTSTGKKPGLNSSLKAGSGLNSSGKAGKDPLNSSTGASKGKKVTTPRTGAATAKSPVPEAKKGATAKTSPAARQRVSK